MAKYYIPLISTGQKVAAFDSTVYSEPITVAEFVEENSEFASIENDTATTYPDLVLDGFATAPQIRLVATEIIGGNHPPQRPK